MNRVCLGKIAGAHGVKGLVKILFFGEDADILNGDLYTSETGADTLHITLKNSQGKHWLAQVDGITDRTEAEKLRHTELWTLRDKLPELPKGQYYIEDLIGLMTQDEKGNNIGKVISVENFGAGDLLEIQPVHGESFYLNFTKENVPSVNMEQKTITIIKPGEME